MDGTPNTSGKKQRQRNQRDKRKPQEKETESASSSPATGNSGTEPQPQRANRRQRNEALTPLANNIGSATSSASIDIKETKEKENVIIDFSNLKKETEEIAKLTKKFAKRNISSNWHRYSVGVPEGVENDGETQEEAPADFSALIKVPASKGGHLQLKDEQEWSSASGEQLGGYFALNLKLLSQSLSCVPIYEQLRLSKHMFTVEELQHFDNLASQASKFYNPHTVEDPTTKVLQTLTNLLKRESDVVEESSTTSNINNCNDFNILDVHGTSQKLDIELEPKITIEDPPVANSNLHKSVTLPNENSKLSGNNNRLLESENNLFVSDSLTEDEISKTGLIDLTVENLSSLSKTKSKNPVEQTVPLSQAFASAVHPNFENTKLLSEVTQEISVNKTKEIPHTDDNNPETIIVGDFQERHTKGSRKSPSKLEDDFDDADLDFLLSLKKPVLPENKKDLKPVLNKDTSFVPGSKGTPQTTSTQPHSELDDWLDSVLQD